MKLLAPPPPSLARVLLPCISNRAPCLQIEIQWSTNRPVRTGSAAARALALAMTRMPPATRAPPSREYGAAVQASILIGEDNENVQDLDLLVRSMPPAFVVLASFLAFIPLIQLLD